MYAKRECVCACMYCLSEGVQSSINQAKYATDSSECMREGVAVDILVTSGSVNLEISRAHPRDSMQQGAPTRS